MIRPLSIALAIGAATGCRAGTNQLIDRAPPAATVPPAMLIGDFIDDYGNDYAIAADLWTQRPHGRFHVRRWDAAGQYLIAQNDSANTHAPGRWTRIDWVALPGMAPYAWAFCLTAYEAPTAAAAESTTAARRDTPRTGCNGYPFSRMRRAELRDTSGGR